MHFFDPDSISSRVLTRVFDLILLNALFLLTSLPLITVGPSLAALYHMTLGILDGTEGKILAGYFRAFRESFLQALLLWAASAALFLFFGYELWLLFTQLPASLRPLQIPVWIVLFLVSSVFIYGFPLIAYTRDTLPHIVKNSILISIANVPTTVFILVIHFLLIALSLANITFRVVLFSLLVFIGCSGLVFFFSLFHRRILQKIAG